MLWIFLFGLVLVLALAALVTAGRKNLERKRSVALANHERVQRELPDSKYAQMGPNEFVEAYDRFLKKRQRKGFWLGAGAMLVTMIALSPFMNDTHRDALIYLAAFLPMPFVILIHGLATGGAYPDWPKRA